MSDLEKLPDPCCEVMAAFDVTLLRALSDPMRLQIIAQLAGLSAPASVSDLTRCCGIDFSGVSRHLKQLREAGIVSAEKTGRETRYRLRGEELAKQLRKMADGLDT